MTVKTLGEYVPPKPPKPYLGLSDDAQVIAALDAVFDRVIAARDSMRLLQAGKDTPSDWGGLCVMSSEHFTLFYRLENNKPAFFWACPNGKPFGLRDPIPGEYWSFGSRGAIWTRHKPDVKSNDFLWQNYWATYPKITVPAGRGKRKSGSGDDTDSEAAAAPGMTPPITISHDELTALGL